jgi:hypothetical protein
MATDPALVVGVVAGSASLVGAFLSFRRSGSDTTETIGYKALESALDRQAHEIEKQDGEIAALKTEVAKCETERAADRERYG